MEQQRFLAECWFSHRLNAFDTHNESLEAIEKWRKNSAHIAAKDKARSTWLKEWQIRICLIEDIYGKE